MTQRGLISLLTAVRRVPDPRIQAVTVPGATYTIRGVSPVSKQK